MSEQLPPDVPDWEDEYIDRVSDRLMHNYDLEREVTVHGEPFGLAGEMRLESEKHFFHPSLNYANHEAREYLYARRQEHVTVSDLEHLVEVGHDIATERVERRDDHFSTDVTFVLVVPSIEPAVADFVQNFSDRTLLWFGFHGHYEINLAVVSPDEQHSVASPNADVVTAFETWEEIEPESPGLLKLIARRLEI
ncbi:hypothetical protein [Halanaeroarchaeum sulfurireducens]|uniref:DUF8052 domain-containing protein n=1 Tax=Halanaeroarchaeum sulfurireducens TaxID=1604004 RepID=A0A0N9MT01_9EURY|nr:hypothetical protein [Halanaeroarchaeum sulfurireducens]ALG81029.1 hypothetical protein HLASA_0113 [Halanaeroarchaeum sulfurireducens]